MTALCLLGGSSRLRSFRESPKALPDLVRLLRAAEQRTGFRGGRPFFFPHICPLPFRWPGGAPTRCRLPWWTGWAGVAGHSRICPVPAFSATAAEWSHQAAGSMGAGFAGVKGGSKDTPPPNDRYFSIQNPKGGCGKNTMGDSPPPLPLRRGVGVRGRAQVPSRPLSAFPSFFPSGFLSRAIFLSLPACRLLHLGVPVLRS